MMRRYLILGLSTAVLLLAVADSALAQFPGANYRPSAFRQPSFSPWLNLYRRDSGVLDPYHNFVRPEQQLINTLQRQQASLQRQNVGLQTLGQQLTQFERTGSVRPTGTASVFMNYSHYYSVRPPIGRRR
ncbi:MAG: hypothetical protein JXB62_14915 [Pirellulales bacterium]|nr:hypothetical protein [Pirellulales bacterium]